MLKTGGWNLEKVTSIDRQTISTARLDVSTNALFLMEMQFRDNNVARAVDKISKQIVNAGTWKLTNNDTTIEVDLSNWKGAFTVTELTKSRMALGTKVKISGVDTDANLEFIPAL